LNICLVAVILINGMQLPSTLVAVAAPSENANEEMLCTILPNGEEECEAVYFDPEFGEIYDEDGHYDEVELELEENQDASSARECIDQDNQCSSWAKKGDCESNPGYMKYQCPVSCETCNEFNEARMGRSSPCTDSNHACKSWAAMGECEFNPNYMLYNCRRSCFRCYEDTDQYGERQRNPHSNDANYEATKELINNTTIYMKEMWTNPEHSRVNYKCRNMHTDCSYWAALGECDANPGYMEKNCAPACQTCHLLDTRLRCPISEGNECIMKPGDLNALFERIVDDADGTGEYLKYKPKALSRPRRKIDGTFAPGVQNDGPWVVTFENFVSDEEADRLIAAGHKIGYERSSDVGVELPDGSHEKDISDGRTSHNAWCEVEECYNDPTIRPVIERIAELTGTHPDNSEHLQLLKYEPGQYYKQHHDYIEYQQEMPCGVRMLTLFLYLNGVEEGGGTAFPLLGLTVQPKKGNAVLWPSVLDEAPEKKDGRTDHEALPVIKGVKYGANAWIHTRNYRLAEKMDCT